MHCFIVNMCMSDCIVFFKRTITFKKPFPMFLIWIWSFNVHFVPYFSVVVEELKNKICYVIVAILFGSICDKMVKVPLPLIQNIFWTSIQRFLDVIDVIETTLCANWVDSFNVCFLLMNEWSFLIYIAKCEAWWERKSLDPKYFMCFFLH